MKMSVTKRMAIIAVMSALYIVLGLISINLGVIKITFASLTTITIAVLLGPLDAMGVALIGSFIEQLVLGYGLTPTTVLWMLPPIIKAGLYGLTALLYRRHHEETVEQNLLIYYASTIIIGLIVTALNTGVIILDAKIFGYPDGLTGILIVMRFVSSILTSIAVAAISIPIIKAIKPKFARFSNRKYVKGKVVIMKKEKNKFFGKYYKFVCHDDGFCFAMIVANSNEGRSIQIITPDGAHYIHDPTRVLIYNEHEVFFDIEQDDITLNGSIKMYDFNPLKRHVMGPFHYIPFMECKHNIYSMFHALNGEITYNRQTISFKDGHGYIEGDKGVNFPSRYVWYNSSLPNAAVTFAIANIPFKLFRFTGVLGFIKTQDKEYYLSTYNFVKVIRNSENYVELKKRGYTLTVEIEYKEGEKLKAPVKGNMTRYIKENVSIKSKYTLKYKNETILTNEDTNSSFEWVWNTK